MKSQTKGSKSLIVFSYEDYRKCLRDYMKTLPRAGHGQQKELSELLRMNPVTLSQIFSGKRDFSSDQALIVSRYMGLAEEETDYFMLMVELSRANSPDYRSFIQAKINASRKKGLALEKIIPDTNPISEEALAQFYSDWRYSAARLLTSIPRFQTLSSLSRALAIEGPELKSIVDFLLKYNLVVQNGSQLLPGHASTYLPAESPFVRHRQMTWRLKAHEMSSGSSRQASNLFFTGPCSISQASYQKFRATLNQLVADFIKDIQSSPPEQLACLNIDFFRMT